MRWTDALANYNRKNTPMPDDFQPAPGFTVPTPAPEPFDGPAPADDDKPTKPAKRGKTSADKYQPYKW